MHVKMSYGNSAERLLVPAVGPRIRVVVLDPDVSGLPVHAVRLDEACVRVQADRTQATPSGASLELLEDSFGDAGASVLGYHVHPLDLRSPCIKEPQSSRSNRLLARIRDQRVAVRLDRLGQ